MGTNRYIDTRGTVKEPVPFTKAVIDGLAPGGGLFVPETIPQMSLDQICALADLPYAQRAAFVYRAFDVDLDDGQLADITENAYGTNFDTPAICPLTSLPGGIHMLELWHGPTSAFKDMALQCLPRFFSTSAAELRKRGELDDTHMILVATSGDTGKAALEGFRDVDGVTIGVMYPDGGVSDIQFKQMATQRGGNVIVWGVRGNFDDCQTGAKTVFNDEDFAGALHEQHHVALSSANSINWGRLMPQIVYYISAYAQLVANGEIERGEKVDVCVPTGNFGNILAAYYARRMGTPIRRLLCASNENRVLTDFINTGVYDISDRTFVKTPSPSMDILVSSNLERQLFELTDRNADAICQWMADLRDNKRFQVDDETFAKFKELYAAGSIDNAQCLETIREVYESCGYLMDPHTAVAYRVAEQLHEDGVPVIVASTAHWAKFGNNVYRALHGIALDDSLPAEIAALTGCALNRLIAEQAGGVSIPTGLAELDDLPIRFTDVIDGTAPAIENAVQAFIANRE